MRNVILIGFSGTGKTTVGKALAERLKYRFVDIDAVVVADAGMPITEIFGTEGEPAFRKRESAVLQRVLEGERQVIAPGGGAPAADENWGRIRAAGCVVALTARPETLRQRLNGATDRPLLKGGVDQALENLLPIRMPRYLDADLVVSTDRREPEQVAGEIAGLLPAEIRRIPVEVPGAPHEITVGRGLSWLAAGRLVRAGVKRLLIVTDEEVVKHAGSMLKSLRSVAPDPVLHVLPPGETAKSIERLTDLYATLAKSGVDRKGALVALGGGVVGDVAGFAAATWLRGIAWLQIPTTLLAMVDSSIGGKTGLNIKAGKNLIGALHQPLAIFTDLAFLDSLPAEQFRTGWAEVIKTAIIAKPALFERLRLSRTALMARDPGELMHLITETCRLKAEVIAEDPEDRGRRAILNYGHTVGHALEAAAGYGRLLHGDAVAWGMQAAAHLSLRMGFCSAELVNAQEDLLRSYDLLRPLPAISPAGVLAAMQHDKKSSDGEARWVLLRDLGRVEYGCPVPTGEVKAVLEELLSG
jgi:3-dehydroquinate synthase